MAKIAINGFGRIGRNTFKAAVKKKVRIAAINDMSDTATIAHLLKYDTVYGRYDRKVEHDESNLIIDGKKIPVFNVKDPLQLPWKKLGIDIVLECTGVFRSREQASMHLTAGAKRVIISAPAKGDDVLPYILGVNSDHYKGDDIIDNASCTTNCIAPVIEVLHSRFGVLKSFMTTVHAYTSDQRLHDNAHEDLRRARAAAGNIIPTSTGSAVSTTRIIPELENKFDGLALRVPIMTGSLSDFTLLLAHKTTEDEVNRAFIEASENRRYSGILSVTNDPIVSSDIIGSEYSAIVDLSLTRVIDGDFVKILSWYDNEWGYSHRLVEMAQIVAKSL